MTKELNEIILKAVSEKIGIELSAPLEHNQNIFCRDAKGFYYVVIGYQWPQGFIVRGVVRSTHRHGRCSFMCNGQVGTMGRQVAWWEESGEDSFVIPLADLPPEAESLVHFDTNAATFANIVGPGEFPARGYGRIIVPDTDFGFESMGKRAVVAPVAFLAFWTEIGQTIYDPNEVEYWSDVYLVIPWDKMQPFKGGEAVEPRPTSLASPDS